jgi:UDPglucose 6-dehydrogenase
MGAQMSRIVVIGNWHNAFVTAAGLAELGHDVTMLNHDETKPWPGYQELPKLNIHEPGLDESMRRSYECGRLHFANIMVGQDGQNTNGQPWSDVYSAHARISFTIKGVSTIGSSDRGVDTSERPILWLAIDTPLRDDDSPDVEPLMTALMAATRGPCERCGRITSGVECHQCSGKCVERASLLVIGSQVPIGFCDGCQKQTSIPVAYVPENFRLGASLDVWRNPDRVVIGATKEETHRAVAELLKGNRTDAPWDKIVFCDLPTAEMTKHATNAFLATSISLANELAKVGELYGVDNQIVAKALKMDSRIGNAAYVRPGLGFAGGTLPRDLRALQHRQFVAKERLNDDAAIDTPLVDAVLNVNEHVFQHVADTITAMRPEVVCLMGYTYKADTNTLRCSPANVIANEVRARNVNKKVIGYDPRMNGKTSEELALAGMGDNMHRSELPTRVGHIPGLVYVVVTPLPEFKKIDWVTTVPGIVYDLCSGVDKQAVLKAGLSYKAIWQPMEKVQ